MTIWGKIFYAAMEVMNSGGFIAIIGVGAAYVGKLEFDKKKVKKETEHLKKEIKDLSSGILVSLDIINDITHKVSNIFNQTKIDRFLILTAMNGKDDLRKCTCVYEQINHQGNVSAKLSLGATGRYFNFIFDSAYRDMLKRIERYGAIEVCKTSEMPDCDLKRIYLAEKVTEAHIFFLKRVKIDEDNDRVFYVSYATHYEGGIIPQDSLTIRLYNEQIKDTFNAIVSHNI